MSAKPGPWNPILLFVLTTLASGIIRLLSWTLRIRFEGYQPIQELVDAGDNVVFVTWHGQQFPLVRAARRHRRKIAILTSMSRDGELQSRILQRHGYQIIRGSSSRGAVAALLALVRALRSGLDIFITGDGPRGPLHEVKAGAIMAAAGAGAMVVPVLAQTSRYFSFSRSWDRYQLPWPFARVIVRFGPPIAVPEKPDKATVAALRLTVQQNLLAMGAQ